MERKYVYFIENEKGEWYWMDMDLRPYPPEPSQGFTSDPLKAWAIMDRIGAEGVITHSKNPLFLDCKATEHEFINPATEA